ncbi:MAG: 4'-phosphopantetheinyl transferase superfamily protein [Elusimicrobiota bacterium]
MNPKTAAGFSDLVSVFHARARPPLNESCGILGATDSRDPEQWAKAFRSAWAPDELRRCEAFLHPRAKAQWLLARLCAKQAAASFLAQRGRLVEPADIEVISGDRPPRIRLVSKPRARKAPAGISLTHSGTLAAALVFPLERRIGIDLQETVTFSKRLKERVFQPAELSLIEKEAWGSRDKRLTALWTIKEAAAKALRQGLAAVLSSVRITDIDGERVRGIYADSSEPFHGLVAPVGKGKYFLSVIEAP